MYVAVNINTRVISKFCHVLEFVLIGFRTYNYKSVIFQTDANIRVNKSP